MIVGSYQGRLELPVHQLIANTTTIRIGSAMDNNSFILAGFVFANNNAASQIVKLHWYDFATTTERMVFKKSIPAGDTWTETEMPLRLVTGDDIRVTAASDVNVTLIYMTSIAV